MQKPRALSGARAPACGGVQVSSSDAVLVMDTCGTSSLVQRFPLAGLLSAAASGAALSAAGGEYRMCWCGRAQAGFRRARPPPPFASLCLCVPILERVVSAFTSPGGASRSCAYSAGSTHSLQLAFLLSPFRLPSFARAPRLVVAREASANACAAGEDFRLDFGQLAILGMSPLRQHRTCVSGRLGDASAFPALTPQHILSAAWLGRGGRPRVQPCPAHSLPALTELGPMDPHYVEYSV